MKKNMSFFSFSCDTDNLNPVRTPIERAYEYYNNNDFVNVLKSLQESQISDIPLTIKAVQKLREQTLHYQTPQTTLPQLVVKTHFREELLLSNKDKIVTEQKEPGENISIENFSKGMIQSLLKANTPFANRLINDPGVFFPDQLSHYFKKTLEETLFLIGIAPPQYWEVANNQSLSFKSTGIYPPSEALNAFFSGPTVWDCGLGIQVSMFQAFKKMLGTKLFNKVFNNQLEAFFVNQSLFVGVASNFFETSCDIKQGNPLFDFFDHVKFASYGQISESTYIQTGDILYVRGIPEYPIKHPFGASQGWNLVCVGSTSKGEKTYLSFDPKLFQEPLTLKEIAKICLESYNEPPEHYGIQSGRTTLAEIFRGHQMPPDTPIVGITEIIRFNPTRLKQWVDFVSSHWRYQALATLQKGVNISNELNDAFISSASESNAQRKMIKYLYKLLLSLSNTVKEARVLVLIDPSKESTHLSQLLLKATEAQGRQVLSFGPSLLNKSDSLMSQKDFNPFSDTLKQADLIIFDNFEPRRNQEDLLLQLFNFAYNEKKSLVVTSRNESVLATLKKDFPSYIRHTNKKIQCLKVVNAFKMPNRPTKTFFSGPTTSKDQTETTGCENTLAPKSLS